MTLDSSALVAIPLDEPERSEFVSLIEQAHRCQISTVTLLEVTVVLEWRRGASAAVELDLLLHRASVKTIPFDQHQLEIARAAFRRYGKGRHPAALNFGDCAAYALAQWSGEPLLFKRNDFALTDVLRVRR